MIYSLIITVPIVIIFRLIGALGYSLTAADYSIYSIDHSMCKLYSFADLMANWTALFTFAFIGCAIYGAIKNKKTNRIKINQTVPHFMFWAISALVLIFVSLLISTIIPIIDLFLLIGIKDKTTDAFSTLLISRLMLVIVLGIYAALCFIPSIIQDAINKKKYGSLEKFEEYRNKVLNLTV
ncbi:hypothetical protein VBM87_01485 [Mycoplasma sp. 744]|uniref:hypothetical protein n=1 Tax=unclassified Mycoplasma TaxID=2683645 RepID=UPI00211C3850|nr:MULTISPECIES: hypothetical protein [unclassified Mycoplasma]MEA4115453.1 hypothetical protein [Mycoplasma sp. 744]UUM18964.1 hypothetical protein NPA14_01310 [Mycoplasma sp. 1018B]